MLGKRNDMEARAADREMFFASAWTLVLVILFWATTPSPENRPIQFSIQGSLGGDVACSEGDGECAEATEMIRIAMPQAFNAPRE